MIISYGRSGDPTITQVNVIASRMATSSQLRSSMAIRDYATRSSNNVDGDIRNFLNTVATSNRYRAQFITYSATDTQGTAYRSMIYLYAANKEIDASGNNSYWNAIFKKNSALRNLSSTKYFIVLAGGLQSRTKIMNNNFDGNYNYR